jgi:hypothetical protein
VLSRPTTTSPRRRIIQAVALVRQSKRRTALADQAFDSYLRWREASEAVSAAYRRWSEAPPTQSDLEFAVYRVALDREEAAAELYSEWMAHGAAMAR